MNIEPIKAQFISLSNDIQNIDEAKFNSLQDAIQNNEQESIYQLVRELADEVLLEGPEQDSLTYSLDGVRITFKPGLLARIGHIIARFFGLTERIRDSAHLENALKIIRRGAKYISLEGSDAHTIRLRSLNAVLSQIINQANQAEQDREEIKSAYVPYIPIMHVLWKPHMQEISTRPVSAMFDFSALRRHDILGQEPPELLPVDPPPHMPNRLAVYDIPEGTGITNGGLTCYLDATLQALRYCRGFREFIQHATANLDTAEYDKTIEAIQQCKNKIHEIQNYFDEADRPKLQEYSNKKQLFAEAWHKNLDAEHALVQKGHQELDLAFKDVVERIAQESAKYKPIFLGDVFDPAVTSFGDLQTRYNEYSQKLNALSMESNKRSLQFYHDYHAAVALVDAEYKHMFDTLQIKKEHWIASHQEEIKLQEARIQQLGKTDAVKNRVKKRLLECMQYVEAHNTPWPWTETNALRDDLLLLGCNFPHSAEHDANEAFIKILEIINFPEFEQRELLTFPNPMPGIPSYHREKKHATRSLRLELNNAVHNLQQFFAPIQTSANLCNEDIFKLMQQEPYKSNEVYRRLMGEKQALSSADVNQLKAQNVIGTIDNLPIQKQVMIDPANPPKLLHIDLARIALGARDTSPVAIPDTLQISGLTFRLKAAVIHAGAGKITDRGHYFTVCPRWSTEGELTHWIAFDDSLATPIYNMETLSHYEAKSFRRLLNENAYGLYYEPIQFPAAAPALPPPIAPRPELPSAPSILPASNSTSSQSSQGASASTQPVTESASVQATATKKSKTAPQAQAKPKKKKRKKGW